jgi:hypothetical protein
VKAAPLRALLFALAALGPGALLAGSPAEATGKPTLKCASFIYASAVTISGSTWAAATAALRSGRFKGAANSIFSTAGWSCSQTGNRPHAHITCGKSGATLRFTA